MVFKSVAPTDLKPIDRCCHDTLTHWHTTRLLLTGLAYLKCGNMKEARKRKKSFTDIEIRKLIELYSQHRDTLTAKQSNVNTNKKKQAAWRLIKDLINT